MFSLFRRLFLFCKSRSFTAETSRWFAAFKFAFEHIEFQVFHFERFKSFTSFGQIFPFLSAESAGLTNLNSLSAPRSGPLVRVKSKFEAKIWSIPYHFETVSVLSKHCFGRTSGSPEKLRANDDPVKFVSLWRPLQALRGSSIELIGLKFFDSFRMSCFFWGSLNWEDSGFKFQLQPLSCRKSPRSVNRTMLTKLWMQCRRWLWTTQREMRTKALNGPEQVTLSA